MKTIKKISTLSCMLLVAMILSMFAVSCRKDSDRYRSANQNSGTTSNIDRSKNGTTSTSESTSESSGQTAIEGVITVADYKKDSTIVIVLDK